MASALSGVKFLDMTGFGPASIAAMMLGDMGAEVIKIDLPPGSGSRGVGDGIGYGPQEKDAAEKIAATMTMSRNKRNLALNLRMEAGQQVFHRLVKTSDAVQYLARWYISLGEEVEPFVPGPG
jgi:CoA:oxalate CoA-transferase